MLTPKEQHSANLARQACIKKIPALPRVSLLILDITVKEQRLKSSALLVSTAQAAWLIVNLAPSGFIKKHPGKPHV